MPFKTHSWLRQHYLKDYAQTMALAKLVANCGCPPDNPKKKCFECRCEMERQCRGLFKSLYPIVGQDLTEENLTALARRAIYQDKHRKFLEAWNPWSEMGKPKYRRISITKLSKMVGVSHGTIKRWMTIERQSKRGGQNGSYLDDL